MFKEEYSLQFDNEEVIHKIKEYLYNKDNIASTYIFGSFGTEDFTNKSDIDIAILTNKDITYSECLIINSELEDIIGIPIDLNNIRSLPEYIQVQVIMANRQLFSKDDILEEKYLNGLNHWIKTELPFWKKLMTAN
ncbi:type VII toxin-antitoxin system MntA family adenylyltransferase antitoxin [Clostridium tagluense]|uniref:type VII toxin-antitoxin system MntA family adenylyltransferase antitoxin n=1 Tax=Clostridium tagluense TaxID=360422 RepID=UPI001C0CD243|nr:nucleotidyltransferase domain-containing protein [Clostridium tagluense]MBU3129436.1 nucleotidyltransferase domain-containing protein [Clostridium tagluense]MBW9156099.1 nucleotidyltransferase domain-containing protein [Clostridium tagluense]WLC65660.1 nucleotidyltransferase domain-containing protein [Clostridium tagluense]